MDFGLSAKQNRLREEVIDFVRNQFSPLDVSEDRGSSFSRENWEKCADFGILGAGVPLEYGGKGWDVTTRVVALEALGFACRDNGLNLGVNTLVWTILEPILSFGSREQILDFVPKLVSGEWLAGDCVTEEQAGSDALNIKTVANKSSEGYVLNGSKRYIGFAPVADVLLVLARTSPDMGAWGISAFLVRTDVEGVSLSPNTEKMGLRSLPMGRVEFKECLVPESSRLGEEGAGLSLFNTSMEYERSFILCSQLGTMERQINDCVEHARSRTQFGQPIGSFQSVSNRIADMRLRFETCRLLLYKCAWLKQNGKSAALESALAKLHLSESMAASSLDAMRTFGGKGYLSEHGIERDLRDAMGGLIYAGTSDIQRNIIAKWLGL